MERIMLIDIRPSARWLWIAACALALVSLGGAQRVRAQEQNDVWRSVGPFEAAGVYELAIDPQTPSTLYAALTRGGVFKSVDGGLSWNATGLSAQVVALA